jgi:chromosomal replication initiation ATPase DnaA
MQKEKVKNAEIEIEVVKQEEEKKIKKNQSADISVEEIQKNWAEVLQKVKPHNNSLEIFLRSAIPSEIEDDLITLEVGYKFHKERLEDSKNSTIIADVLSEVLGRPVRIKGKVAENRPKPARKAESQVEEVDPVEIFGKLV